MFPGVSARKLLDGPTLCQCTGTQRNSRKSSLGNVQICQTSAATNKFLFGAVALGMHTQFPITLVSSRLSHFPTLPDFYTYNQV